MREQVAHEFDGLVIGQAFESGDHDVMRIVAIDPELHCLQAEDGAGALVMDDIAHFTATHRPAAAPLTG